MSVHPAVIVGHLLPFPPARWLRWLPDDAARVGVCADRRLASVPFSNPLPPPFWPSSPAHLLCGPLRCSAWRPARCHCVFARADAPLVGAFPLDRASRGRRRASTSARGFSEVVARLGTGQAMSRGGCPRRPPERAVGRVLKEAVCSEWAPQPATYHRGLTWLMGNPFL